MDENDVIVEDNAEEVRREVQKHFRVHGIELKRDASLFTVNMLKQYDKERRKKWLEKLVEMLKKQTLNSSVLDEETVKDVFQQISTHGQKEDYQLFNVFDVLNSKRFDFDVSLRRMRSIDKPGNILTNVSAMTHARRQRFLMVQQRALRLPSLKHLKLTSIESLSSCSKKIRDVIVLGLISQQKAVGTYHIEDLTGSLQVDFLPETKYHSAIFTEGTIALFEGNYDAGILSVSEVALVPPEDIATTRQELGNSTENWFGGEDSIAFRCNPKLRAAEMQSPDASIIILSDIHLDDPKTMRNLFTILSGYVDSPPTAFLFCGNFCSRPREKATNKLLENGFKMLANQINEVRSAYPQTSWVFVPGPDDPSLNMILPRPNLPRTLFDQLAATPHVYFSSNPARIQYATQEIVVMRDDMIEKMCRHSINAVPSEETAKWFSKTILSQAHLCPLPQHIQPVAWELDDKLRLHPLPDLLVIADRFPAFEQRAEGLDTLVLNPGSFSRAASFYVYYPASRRCEKSGV